ncbi:MAG TPA: hypothetical protein VKY24_12935 [Reyranella sp.]|jgi:hypothetical protein|nr:hypothetical protein [Reyranella sp.]
MLFMVVEKFRDQHGKAVYRKLRSGCGLVEFEVVPVGEGKTACPARERLL